MTVALIVIMPILFVVFLDTIDRVLLEAAAIDGANRWDRLVWIKILRIFWFQVSILVAFPFFYKKLEANTIAGAVKG